jgi:hypothetical protein
MCATIDNHCFLPMHIYEAHSGKSVATIQRLGKTPNGVEVAIVLRHVIGRVRARWPRIEILVRGDSHYGRIEPSHGASATALAKSLVSPATSCC